MAVAAVAAVDDPIPAAATVKSTSPLTTRRDTDAEHREDAFGTRFAQQELYLNLVDFFLPDDGTTIYPGTTSQVPDYTRAMTRALEVASRPDALATICFPAGSFVMAPFSVTQPIRLLATGLASARYGTPSGAQLVWGGTTLVRTGGSTGPFVTIAANGVTIEGMSFDGGGASAVGIHVVNGFELRMLRCRVINHRGTGLLIDLADNALFDTVMVNNCGATAGAASVVVNSFPQPAQGRTRTNSVDFRSLTIEQNRASALEIGADPAKNCVADDQYPEYLRFSDLHIESSVASGSDAEFLPKESAVTIGVLNSATFVSPTIYGGPAPLIRQDADADIAGRSAGLTLVGGVLRGQIPHLGKTPTLVELVRGNEFRLIGTRFTQFFGSPVSVGAAFGDAVHIDVTAALGSSPSTPGGIPLVADDRGYGVATTNQQVLGTMQLFGPIASRARGATSIPAGAHVAAIELAEGSDEVRGRLIMTTSSTPAPGQQARIILPASRSLPGSASIVVTPSDAATARLLPFAQLRNDRSPAEIWIALSSVPSPESRYGFYYTVIG